MIAGQKMSAALEQRFAVIQRTAESMAVELDEQERKMEIAKAMEHKDRYLF